MVTVDDESPPGAWDRELKRHPWGYGQYRPPSLEEALWIIRKHGLGVEADVIVAEIAKLKASSPVV